MATNLKSRTLFLALGLIFLLAPVTAMAAEAVGPQSDEGGPVKIFLTGGGCQNCLKDGHGRPTCNTACEMPLAAVVQNTDKHHGVAVEVTLSFSFPWAPGPVLCQHSGVVRVEVLELPANSQVAIDFSQIFSGDFRGATFMVTTVITDSDDPGLLGKTEVEFVPVRTFWPICDN